MTDKQKVSEALSGDRVTWRTVSGLSRDTRLNEQSVMTALLFLIGDGKVVVSNSKSASILGSPLVKLVRTKD